MIVAGNGSELWQWTRRVEEQRSTIKVDGQDHPLHPRLTKVVASPRGTLPIFASRPSSARPCREGTTALLVLAVAILSLHPRQSPSIRARHIKLPLIPPSCSRSRRPSSSSSTAVFAGARNADTGLTPQVWIVPGDIILLSLRDFQDDRADVIHKYTADEARNLKTYGELKSDFSINENAADGECPFRERSERMALHTLRCGGEQPSSLSFLSHEWTRQWPCETWPSTSTRGHCSGRSPACPVRGADHCAAAWLHGEDARLDSH